MVLTFTGESQLTLICAMTSLGEIKRHEGHIFVAVQMPLPGRDDRLRACFDEVIHDGKIVRRKVPKHVDIVLEEAQIDASGIVVVELSQSSFLEQLRDFLHRAGEQEGVVDHDLEIFLAAQG